MDCFQEAEQILCLELNKIAEDENIGKDEIIKKITNLSLLCRSKIQSFDEWLSCWRTSKSDDWRADYKKAIRESYYGK